MLLGVAPVVAALVLIVVMLAMMALVALSLVALLVVGIKTTIPHIEPAVRSGMRMIASGYQRYRPVVEGWFRKQVCRISEWWTRPRKIGHHSWRLNWDLLKSWSGLRNFKGRLVDAPGLEIVSARRNSKGAVCCICSEPLDSTVVYCRSCRTPHHYDCWAYIGHCSLYGCGDSKCFVIKPRMPEIAVKQSSGRQEKSKKASGH
jgi:hypothetical protein